jgi:hypothetical protein
LSEAGHDARSGGIKVHIAVGYTDLRKGLDGLAVLVE